jgi:hypothetical protein
MSYDFKMESDALADVRPLPTLLLQRFYLGLDLLTRKPTVRSRPSATPHQSGQLYEFSVEFDDMTCLFTVWFQYGADEKTLYILRVLWETM